MRNAKIFTLVALALVSFACKKETGPEDKPVVPDNPNAIVFTAGAPEKTAIDANDQVVTWVAGDEVKFVWAGGSTTAAASTSGASTTFSVEVADGITELYAVYPASAGGSYDNGNVNVHFNGTRTDGSFAANDFAVAKAVKTGDTWSTTLAFKNVACLLKVGVSTNDIVRLQVKGLNDEVVSGLLPVNIDNGTVTFGTPTSTGTSMNMTVSGPGNYYIPVMPGVTFSNGFRVNLFTDDETQGTPFYYNGSFTTARGQIIKMDDIEGKAGHYYVTPSGAGAKAGQSWANAMSAAQFKEFVEDQDNFFLLRGATFHFSAEEFSFGDDYVKPSYPDHGNVNFTIEGTITPTDTTTFLGRTNTTDTGNDVKAGVLWPQYSTYLTVKNVKFTGTNGASNASVIRINNSAKEVNLDHCYFRNNQTSGNGGSISLFNSATVTIKNCSFSGNIGAGGLIHVNNTSANVIIQDTEVKGCSKNAVYAQSAQAVTLTRVTFKDNDDAGEYGAAAFIGDGNSSVSFVDCDFLRNHSTSCGGAVAIKGANPSVSFTDCDFIDNSSDGMGGAAYIYSGNAKTTFTGGKFQGNHADGAHNTNAAGAAIYATGSGVKVSCTDVLFKENYNYIGTNTYSGGILRIQQEGGEGYFNGCVFDGNWTNRENSANNPCAAIVNCRVGDVKYYFNACEFKENTSGVSNDAGRYGGLRGTVFATLAGSTFAFNNCSFHDNYGGRNSDDISWIGMDNASSTLILANTTIAGDNYRAPETGAGRKNNWGVIKFQNTGNYYFLNSIVCSLDPVGNSFWVNGDIMVDGTTKISAGGPKLPVYCWYSKISKEGDNRTAWTEDTGSGHDYYATSASFGNWSAPYTWNGTLTGTNSGMKAATADVNTQIQNADADFYAWLNSIGALGKDINGNNRGATSWPGCYQN